MQGLDMSLIVRYRCLPSKQETLNKLRDFTLGSISLVFEVILLGGGGGRQSDAGRLLEGSD